MLGKVGTEYLRSKVARKMSNRERFVYVLGFQANSPVHWNLISKLESCNLQEMDKIMNT